MMKSLTLPASADDLDLAVLASVPDEAPRGIVQLVHGMCEHKERYIPFMEWLTGHGYVCVIHDHRGHGASVKEERDLGYLYEGGWEAMVEDVRVVSDWIREQWPGLLCTYQFTANGFYTLMGLMQDCYSLKGWKVARPDLPVHFISGAEDPCRVSDKALEQAVELMRQVGYRQVDLKLYPGMRHEILNETDRQQVWDDVLALL